MTAGIWSDSVSPPVCVKPVLRQHWMAPLDDRCRWPVPCAPCGVAGVVVLAAGAGETLLWWVAGPGLVGIAGVESVVSLVLMRLYRFLVGDLPGWGQKGENRCKSFNEASV